jgi:hypothetical protein
MDVWLINSIENIDKIDIRKTFETILHKSEYCYSLLEAIKEELAGKPLPEVPREGIEYLMWVNEGVIAYSYIPFYREFSVTPVEMIKFTKLNPTQQKRALYRAAIHNEWCFEGRITPLVLSLLK